MGVSHNLFSAIPHSDDAFYYLTQEKTTFLIIERVAKNDAIPHPSGFFVYVQHKKVERSSRQPKGALVLATQNEDVKSCVLPVSAARSPASMSSMTCAACWALATGVLPVRTASTSCIMSA